MENYRLHSNHNSGSNRADLHNTKPRISFYDYHKNTLSSLHDVEYFLNDLTRFKKCINLFKFLR